MDLKEAILDIFNSIDFYYYQETIDDEGFECLIISNSSNNDDTNQCVFAFRFLIDYVQFFFKDKNIIQSSTSIVPNDELLTYIKATVKYIELKGIEGYIDAYKKLEKKNTND